jgi:hypothetical protein
MMPEMVEKLMRLRYPAICSHCESALAPGTQGWWDPDEKEAICPDCHRFDHSQQPAAPGEVRSEAAAQSETPESGEAGASARRIYEGKRRRREERIEEKWGAAAGLVKFFSKEPQSTKAWVEGSDGERRLATLLAKAVDDEAVLLHDRRIPRSHANIDHIAVAASGIWIIDAKNYKGKVEQRDVGGLFKSDQRLYVDNRDRTKLARGLARQIDAVLEALENADVPIDAALCFVDAEWGFFSRPFRQGGVWITWPKRLCENIAAPGPLSPDDIALFADRLASTLPPAVSASAT